LSRRGKSLNSSEKTVEEEVASLFGLDYDAFKRSVMLAQGEFAAFLKAEKEVRREILEATADIHVYDTLKEKLNEKVDSVSEEYDNINRNLERIGEVSEELVKQESDKLNTLDKEVKELGKAHEEISKEKVIEIQREENYQELQESEKQLDEINKQQSDITDLKQVLARANQADKLLPEKQSFDNANSDYKRDAQALQQSESQLEEEKQRNKKLQKDCEKKEQDYTAAVTKKNDEMQIYADARTDLELASEKFDEVEDRRPNLQRLKKEIDTATEELKQQTSDRKELNTQISNIQAFLNQNPLPPDRNQRQVKLTTLLTELKTYEQQLNVKNTSHSEYVKKIKQIEGTGSDYSKELEILQDRENKLTKTRNITDQKYETLQNEGSLDDWQEQKDNSIKGQPIAQRYESLMEQVNDEQRDVTELESKLDTIEDTIADLEKQHAKQTQLCKRTDAEVKKLEADEELAKLAEPVSQLRQQLEAGEPCLVCGSTEHPYADMVEIDSHEFLETIQNQLKIARETADEAVRERQKLEQDQVSYQRDHTNTIQQIETCKSNIKKLNSEIDNTKTDWHAIYQETDISSDTAHEQYEEADTAINNLNTALNAYNAAVSDLAEITQKRETCDANLKREKQTLDETKQQLTSAESDMEDLKSDISEKEKLYWESMPSAFHGDTPDNAFRQFSEKIDEVERRETELSTKNNRLDVVKTEIQSNESQLEGLHERHKEQNEEIDNYLQEGEAYIEAVKEKTGGLENEDQINNAINELERSLKTKEEARNTAQAILDKCNQDVTAAQTTHNIAEQRLKDSKTSFEKIKRKYHKKLKDVGFVSTKDHEKALRDSAQLEEITEKISAYENEMQQLIEETEELRQHFVDSAYDPKALDRITTKETEIEQLIEEKQQKIGATKQKIKDLNAALKKREDIEEELTAAKNEMERWKTLQETIPKNTLRDFALEIIFKQMGILANAQLRILTSERYQLKVESIGDLTVIDRWNANEERPVETLSGGESFLTSLALALALSELSQGRAQLNSLFLDEGFGTLDAETLDVAIASLEGLQMQGRSIYLISHIQELTRRLPVKIRVRKRGNGSSYIEKH
ncbi:hypothetical protein F4225_05055, partial [Candidatus Poribacteria bacterium]|nr:hypothetical protein [Candidatus Poribacteria bacterium]